MARPTGSKNKRSMILAKKASIDGISPLEFLLNILRDTSFDMEMRIDAAKSAAPYVHPRLATTILKNEEGKAFNQSLDIMFHGVK